MNTSDKKPLCEKSVWYSLPYLAEKILEHTILGYRNDDDGRRSHDGREDDGSSTTTSAWNNSSEW